MLIEFEVGNYASFKTPVRFSMAALSPIKEWRDSNVFKAGRFNLLRSAAIYGANASGKSNFLNALVGMRWFVLNSSKETQANEPIDFKPFKLDASFEQRPSRFEVRFLLDRVMYRYGFEADSRAVRAEWLFHAPKVKETPLFLRQEEEIDVDSHFKEGQGKEDLTRENVLFLSLVAHLNGALAAKILRWFASIGPLHGLHDIGHAHRSISMLKSPEGREKILHFLKTADLGIEDLELNETVLDLSPISQIFGEEARKLIPRESMQAKGFSITSVHAKYSDGRRVGTARLDFEKEESEGTKKFFRLAGPILESLDTGAIVIVDEMDAKIHPLLNLAIVRLFNSPKTNPRNAQLIFATHDTNLLRCGQLRRDQIWFVEKNREEASDLYSLAAFKLPRGIKVRNDAALAKNYIAGRYGAVPYFGDFSSLFEQGNHG